MIQWDRGKLIISLRVPKWAISAKVKRDLDARSALTGKASVSRSWFNGIVSVITSNK